MNKVTICLLMALVFSLTYAGGHGGSNGRRSSSHSAYRSPSTRNSYHRTSHYAASATRDNHGRIKRSESAKRQFMKQSGYAHGRKGYVVDHVVPLSKGGSDSPS